MRVQIVNGPSLRSVEDSRLDIKEGRIASINMLLRDEEGHEFKVLGEPKMIVRKNGTIAEFLIDIKHANVGGKDKDCPAAKAFRKEVRDILYNADVGTGYVELDA